VHAKKVIQELAELQIGDKDAFEWTKNLRYYVKEK
jgi:hypothetical protein